MTPEELEQKRKEDKEKEEAELDAIMDDIGEMPKVAVKNDSAKKRRRPKGRRHR